MRINWFSPLMPQRTDIAHFTARLAEALTARFDVVFWTNLPGEPSLLPPGARVEVFEGRAGLRGEQLNRLLAGVNLYNIGNDASFHSDIAVVAKQIPGVVVLHDTRLHHFEFERSRDDYPAFATYLDQAEALYGSRGADAARAVVEGAALIDDHVETMPFVEPYLESALGVICHSEAAKREVQALSDTPVLTMPLPFATLGGAVQARRRWKPPWRLVAFGYMNPNRRLEQIFEALAGWRDAPPFQLDILGSIWDPAHIRQRISALGLQGRVRIHGFVPEAVLDDFIANAHLAFNLRHPTMGEASGGILRCWAQATPALVTDAGWYRQLSDDVALKISVENEIEDIRSALDRLTREPASCATVGMTAQERVSEHHSPERYASHLDGALREFPRMAQRYAARRMLQRVADRLQNPLERRALLERSCSKVSALFG